MATQSVLGLPEVRTSLLDHLHHATRRRSAGTGSRSCGSRTQSTNRATRTSGTSQWCCCAKASDCLMTAYLLPPEEDPEVLDEDEFEDDSDVDADEDEDIDEDDEEEETWQVGGGANCLTS